MSGDERTFDDRLEECAKSLAAARDIHGVLAIRAEIMALICADTVDDGPSRKLRSRVGKLRRHAELIIGEMLIEMRASGLRRTEGGNQKKDSRPTLADLGLRDARPERWQARARARRRA
jgi:hypothetical protein